MLWYPLACVVAAAAFAVWVWIDCDSVKAVAPCRSEIAGETMWAFAIVLAIGLGVLGLVWLATLPVRRRGDGRRDGEGHDEAADDMGTVQRTDDGMARRSARHARSGDPRTG
jgi:hypothetical protein